MQNIKSQLVNHSLESQILKTNALGDPSLRQIAIYFPSDYLASEPLPALLALAGFGSSGLSFWNYDPTGEDLKTRLDRLIFSGVLPPVIVVAPDCFTRFGGNQYVNSLAIGNYADFLIQEVLPFVTKNYRIKNWGVFGKSSGGFGAITLAMRHPRVFTAVANQSGDCNFELTYLPEFLDSLREFKKFGGVKAWFDHFSADINRQRKQYRKPLMMLAMAASYSPNPGCEMLAELPFDGKDGRFRPEVWERWREWDPINAVKKYADSLKLLKGLYIDCGKSDEFGLHLGATALSSELKANGVTHHFEDFDDGHMSISYRFDVSLPFLARALTAE
jgi:enterochelin esterase-like enzyme